MYFWSESLITSICHASIHIVEKSCSVWTEIHSGKNKLKNTFPEHMNYVLTSNKHSVSYALLTAKGIPCFVIWGTYRMPKLYSLITPEINVYCILVVARGLQILLQGFSSYFAVLSHTHGPFATQKKSCRSSSYYLWD